MKINAVSHEKLAVIEKIVELAWLIRFRDAISAVEDSHSSIAAISPAYGVGNIMPLLCNDLVIGGALEHDEHVRI